MSDDVLDWSSWAQRAPEGRAESIYYILGVPMSWAGPPPGAGRYSGLHFKIGRTRNVLSRVRNLRTGTSDELIVHAMEPGSATREAQVHRLFADERRQGEWFAASPALVEHVYRVWRTNHLLPPEHQRRLVWFFERSVALCKVRQMYPHFDMVNPSINEPWVGSVLVDLTNPSLYSESDDD